jgi:hypothetical protein
MAIFRFTTSGNLHIELQGLEFGAHRKDPKSNVKTYITHPKELTLNAADQSKFTDWGEIELIDRAPGTGHLIATIDSPTLGWYGTAQFAIFVGSSNILNDNFQSGVRGPLGDPSLRKTYRVDFIG